MPRPTEGCKESKGQKVPLAYLGRHDLLTDLPFFSVLSWELHNAIKKDNHKRGDGRGWGVQRNGTMPVSLRWLADKGTEHRTGFCGMKSAHLNILVLAVRLVISRQVSLNFMVNTVTVTYALEEEANCDICCADVTRLMSIEESVIPRYNKFLILRFLSIASCSVICIHYTLCVIDS